jgi:hypothetical protein
MSEQNARASALIMRPTPHSVKRVRKENPFWDMALDNDNHPNLLQDDAFDVVLIHMRLAECL